MIDFTADYFKHLRADQSYFVKTVERKETINPEKLKTLIEMEVIVLDKLERMPDDVVDGYKPGLKILGEVIQKGLDGLKSEEKI